MTFLVAVVLFAVEASTGPPGIGLTKVSFAKDDVGKLPKSWERAQTGKGEGNLWKVVADESTPTKSGFAPAQTAKGPNQLFNMAILKGSRFLDGTVSVKIKSVDGNIDQGGGVVWRYQDADNYYICRYNPLEENFRVYKVIKGKRTQLATKENVETPGGKWHTVSITQQGKRITCSLDGKVLLEVEDDTITVAGEVGLWTKADAQTYFDDFAYSPNQKK